MCLAIVGALVGLAGSVVSGAAAASAAQQEAENNRAVAKQQERQAEINVQTGVYEAARTEDTVRRTTGAQRAGFAANGIALEGSAYDVIDDTAREGALDVAAIKWNSDLKADNNKYEAKISRIKGNAAERSAGAAFLAPVLGGAARFIGAFG